MKHHPLMVAPCRAVIFHETRLPTRGLTLHSAISVNAAMAFDLSGTTLLRGLFIKPNSLNVIGDINCFVCVFYEWLQSPPPPTPLFLQGALGWVRQD